MKTKKVEVVEGRTVAVLPVNGHDVTFTVEGALDSARARELVAFATKIENEARAKVAPRKTRSVACSDHAASVAIIRPVLRPALEVILENLREARAELNRCTTHLEAVEAERAVQMWEGLHSVQHTCKREYIVPAFNFTKGN